MDAETKKPFRKLKAKAAIKIMNKTAFPIGDTVEGTWMKNRIRTVNDTNTGNLKDITDLLLKSDEGKFQAIPLDAGLRVALSEFDVTVGTYISLKKLPQIAHGANMVNQYEVMVAE